MFAVLQVEPFALQAVLRIAPPPTGAHPAALLAGAGRPARVAQLNAAARAAGVAPGMSAPQALARCPALALRAADAVAEAEGAGVLLAAALTLAPVVEWTAPGVCTVDLRGAEPARLRPAAEAALRQLAGTGFAGGAGAGRTPRLAWYAARLAAEPSPGRLLLVEDEPAFLGPLPIAFVDPSPAQVARLEAWGIRTLGQLVALTPGGLGRRLGRDGRDLWERARGGEPRPLRPAEQPRDFTAAGEHEVPVDTLEPLLFPLRRQLERLALELAAAGLAAEELTLTLRLEDGPPRQTHLRLPEPAAAAGSLFRMLETHLAGVRTAAPVRGWHLAVRPVRAPVRQRDFLAGGLRDPHAFAETLARVAALVGTGRVGTPVPADTHRPDAARLEPPPRELPPPLPPGPHPWAGPPLRRFRPPLPARLEFTAAARRPAYVWTERFAGGITGMRGPWCRSGDWWEPERAWARTEWDIALAGGGLYRLLRVGAAYFIEGEYD